MKRLLFLAIAVLLAATPALYAQRGNLSGHGTAVVTVLPNNSSEQALKVTGQDVTQITVGGKTAQVTHFDHFGPTNPVELVFLIDSSAMPNLGTQFGAIKSFVREMPPNARMAIAYMQNGTAAFTGPLSSNPSRVLKALRVTSGPVAQSASPYFCISDLAKHWPSHDLSARRIAVVISDGIDYYDLHYDLSDPYVQAAISDAVRNHVIVYFLYWQDVGRINRLRWEQGAGQNLMSEVTNATGGYSYWVGFGNPVSFTPYLKDLRRRLDNQFAMEFAAQIGSGNGQIESLNLKLNVPNAKIDVPKDVFVLRNGSAPR